MKRFLLSSGLLLPLAIILVNTQNSSVADYLPVASTKGIVSVSMLDKPVKEVEIVHAQQHVARPNITRSVSPRRRVTTKAAAVEQDTPPVFAVIEQSDATIEHKQLFNEALHVLPKKCQNTLQNLYVKYEKQASRGLAGKSVMILDGTVKSNDELRALFIHESGHNFDLGCLRGNKASGKSQFSDGDEPIYNDDPSLHYYAISWITSKTQNPRAQPEDFVSGYASHDMFEDFAEGFAYFVLQNKEFAKRAESNDALARKYIFFRDVLFDGQIPSVATGRKYYNGVAPWDITKLSYNWHPEVVLGMAY